MTQQESMTVGEAADFAKCGLERVYEALRSGALTGTNLGGKAGWRTTRTHVNDWVNRGYPSTMEGEPDEAA
jgi:excisionase family DNA binding protein